MPRKKQFDICREFLCSRKVIGGKPIDNIEKRYCRYHIPKKLKIFERIRRLPKRSCKQLRNWKECYEKSITNSNVCIEIPNHCKLIGRNSFDPDRRWKRVSCFCIRKKK